MKTAYIVAAYRTPGCKARKGKLKDVRPDDLAATAIKGLTARTGLDHETIDDIILGCAFPEGEQGMNVARVASFKADIPIQVPAQTINRFCSSGLQAISMAADRIMAGQADCIIAGGVESMSCIPMGGTKYSTNPNLVQDWPETYASMGTTAEMVAEKYGITREAMDEFAFQSHQKAAQAIAEKRFVEEIIPVAVERTWVENNRAKKETVTVDIDDGVRSETTVEGLGKLRPVFRNKGTVTAGNASQTTDGAAVSLVVSEAYLKRLSIDPIARFLAFSVRGCPPEIMGIGPVEAIPIALKMAGLDQKQIELIELNEAFAAQSLAVIQELKLDPQIINVNGGAIALGHPLGCTGAKLTATLLHSMKRLDLRYGIVSMCIGGGMGAAGLMERL